ncbi:stage III sporulation protein AF [Candidatus Epulonipiscium viviparus]|uniref:stage III sporulation protein AF n=1 Tax=Candidatus Epulonipiscium viviparus TaxID=420336 RepID=UPI00016BFB18|nr:stage III sporulation protein AF [Candidatus Epulopiscium viviparus]
MISNFIEYLMTLVWVMLFLVVVEMVFPSSALQKYIKLILRFILVYTILAPIIKGGLFETIQYDEYVNSYQDQFDMMTEGGTQMHNYEQELKENYELREIEIIEQAVEKELDMNAEVVVSSIVRNYIPQLTDIEITVSKNESTDDGLIKVPKIVIGKKSDSVRLYKENIEKEIKNLLSNFYNLGQVNINIEVQNVD